MAAEEHHGHTFLQEEARMLSLMYQAAPVGHAWQDEALCVRLDPVGEDLDLWFAPDGSTQAKEATEVCFSCPVRKECLLWASRSKQKYGIWGGLPRSLRIQKTSGKRDIKPHDFEKLVNLPNPYETDDERSRFHEDNLTDWNGDDVE